MIFLIGEFSILFIKISFSQDEHDILAENNSALYSRISIQQVTTVNDKERFQ